MERQEAKKLRGEKESHKKSGFNTEKPRWNNKEKRKGKESKKIRRTRREV